VHGFLWNSRIFRSLEFYTGNWMTSIESNNKDCNLCYFSRSEFSSDLAICQNMLCEKSECSCCVDLYTGYSQSAAFSFYPEQAPYNSTLPPPGQFMSDMEGKNFSEY
jgi:hypothetical protein